MEVQMIQLKAEEMPQQWYNIQADLPELPPPPLHPVTKKPVGPDDLAPIFPMELIKQEMSRERWITIPDEVLEVYQLWRPTPLVRATRLEEYLGTPARIYFKNESYSPPGSHKPNTAVAQAYYNKKEGVERIATETGAGQWGSALAFATNLFGLKCIVYMVKVSYYQKPYRRSMIQLWGGEIFPSPSSRTKVGRDILAKDPDSPGSLGVAISEALEETVSHPGTKYSLGSVLNHVLMHQTIVGLETKKQMAQIDEYPDVLIGCVGGGSNFAGFTFPFIHDKLKGKEIDVIAVEPTATPTLTKGPHRYDFGDVAGLTPMLKMYTLGHNFIPPKIHAGGLRYHGMAPLVSQMCKTGLIRAEAYHQIAAFEAGRDFARTQGFIPAPETNHAIAAVIAEAKRCRETKQEKVIVFNFSGHGLIDLSAYDEFLAGKLQDYEYPKEKIEEAISQLPQVEK